ncbi:hypothetical protein ACFOY4_28610 [Actinomadura syzygii]|uniref:Uncharacterized protein n=1 Tax=Actinomadura syzygii TaxID=1427538 RepID=A0A5D0UES4_9ACTN|nr:hypothetical protein [Actinomadura syzygii]TYC16587.1 hypothetical protein FXF65_08335 [Actinomadura syzygii]
MSGLVSSDDGAGVEEDVEVPPAMAKDLSPAVWYAKARKHLKEALTRAGAIPVQDDDSLVSKHRTGHPLCATRAAR